MADDIENLLTEIRDIQREHLAEYRRVAERTLAVQSLAMKRQARSLQIGVVALLVIFIGIGIVILGTYMGH